MSELNNYTDFDTLQPAAAPLGSETHSGADVGIFATGEENQGCDEDKLKLEALGLILGSWPKASSNQEGLSQARAQSFVGVLVTSSGLGKTCWMFWLAQGFPDSAIITHSYDYAQL